MPPTKRKEDQAPAQNTEARDETKVSGTQDVVATSEPAMTEDQTQARAEEAGSWDAADHTGPEGQSFYNPATTGSGTILPDGTYGAPLPDPVIQRTGGEFSATTSPGGVERGEDPRLPSASADKQ